jgi:hypothetical protein
VEVQPVVVIAVVRIAIPVARQADRVWRRLEAAVPNELGGQTGLDALEHELEKLPVQQRTDGAPDGAGIDRDTGACGRLRTSRSESAGDDAGDRCQWKHERR